jgi:hypothetical protein
LIIHLLKIIKVATLFSTYSAKIILDFAIWMFFVLKIPYFCASRIANHSIAVWAQAQNEESPDNAEQPHHLTGGYRASKGRGNREGHRKKPPCFFGFGRAGKGENGR